MQIEIGKTSYDRKKINKTFTTAVTIDADILEPCSISEPVFIVEYNSAILTSNYLYCAAFARYYFITDITVDNGGRLKISCKRDVLKSYASNILNLNCTIARNEYANSGYQVDNMLPLVPKCDVSYIEILNETFNIRTTGSEFNFVICIAGGNVAG